MKFSNNYINKIYRYLKLHNGQVIFRYEMADDLRITQPTLRKYLRWLQDRDLIKIWRHRIWVNQEF